MSDQIYTETVVENVVTDAVTETTPVVETVEEVVVEEKEKKTKSFFEIFKKDKPAEEATEAAVVTEATESAEATEAAAEEVPVETAPAKKGFLCGLCALGKKEAAPAAPAATEEAAPAPTEEAAVEESAAPEAAAEEAVTSPVIEESHPDEASFADVAAVAVPEEAEEAAETTEGEAVAAIDEADVARAGILFKSGKFFKSNMNERHCRLLSTGAFQYSKTEDFTTAHECKITAETTTVAFMAEGEDAPHKYRFELHCCGTVSTYAADTEEDRDEWIRAIETVKESIPIVIAEVTTEEEVSEEAPAVKAE